MYWSKTLIPTAKEVPADAKVLSHQLMVRAGLVRALAAGIYDWLPLGFRAVQKASNIIRQEMARAGADEVLLPALLPADLWKQTGRYEAYGPDMFRLKDRKGTEMVLGPTHEEIITELVKGYVSSYKQLPVVLYQIQQKFRDEARPRNGLMRVREFLMKDAYSFHASLESLAETYKDMYAAYQRIFARCGLDVIPVEADSGAIGGDASHEFILPCDTGEDVIVRAADGSYAANVERAVVSGNRPKTFADAVKSPLATLETIHTPNVPGIDEVCKFLNTTPDKMIKTLVYTAPAGKDKSNYFLIAAVRGDHEVNEAKLQKLAPGAQLANDEVARAAGFVIGYVGPHIVNTAKARLIIDPDALALQDAVTGANEQDHHVKNFDWLTHLTPEKQTRATVADIRMVAPGDTAPNGSPLLFSKGIELGHVFKLGTKYTDALGCTFLDQNQKAHSMIMGCYGIGPGRIIVGALETRSDDDGIRWPMAIAPYHVIIVPIKYEGQAKQVADQLHTELTAAGLDVLVDDRDQRPGVKFKDADLIGIPLRIVLGDKGLANNEVEFKRRDSQSTEMLPLAGLTEKLTTLIHAEL